MNIYIGKTANNLNRKPWCPENITPRICVNPLYPSVVVSGKCNMIVDSGAYQDESHRLSLEGALSRQIEMERRIGQPAEYIVAYDKIGDIKETMVANEYLLKRAEISDGRKILVTQGGDDSEYSRCLKNLIDLHDVSSGFVIGFGGVAKCGTNPKIEARLYNAILENKRDLDTVDRVHIFGCFTDRVLKTVEHIIPEVCISVDTSTCEMRSVMGNVFCNGQWAKTYSKDQKYSEYHPNDLAHDNVRRVVDYYEGETMFRYGNLSGGVCG
jgi:hypothetical protein